MKKWLSIFLVLVLTLPVLGTYTWLCVEKHLVKKAVKKQIKNGLTKDDLTLLKFTITESQNLNWEHSGEFEYNDTMYDVIFSEEKGNTIYYWCWLDSEETALNQKLASMVNKTLDGETSSQGLKIQTALLILYQEPSPHFVFGFPSSNETFTQLFLRAVTPSLSPPTPPPQTHLG